jgi:hypothetical protein
MEYGFFLVASFGAALYVAVWLLLRGELLVKSTAPPVEAAPRAVEAA